MTLIMEPETAIAPEAIDAQPSPAEQAAAATVNEDDLRVLMYTAVNETTFHTCLKAAALTTLLEAAKQMEEKPNFTKIRKKVVGHRIADLHALGASEAAASETVEPPEAPTDPVEALADTAEVAEEPLAPEPPPVAAATAQKPKRGKKAKATPTEVVEAPVAVEPVDDRVVLANIAPALQGFKFVCDRAEFAKYLPSMKRLVGNPSHAILANVLIEADAKTNTVVMTAFNLSAALRITAVADVQVSGKFTLPCALLNDLFARLPDEAISFEHDLNESNVIIGSTVGKHHIQGMDAAEFPDLPNFKGKPMDLPMAPLLIAINYCEFSASGDPTKQVLCGLHMTLKGDQLDVASTDGHRLSTHEQKLEATQFPLTEFTLPTSAIADLRQLASPESTVQIAFDDDLKPEGQLLSASFMRFEAKGNLLICRLLDGQYPDYRRLVPKQMERLAVMDNAAFAAAVDRVALFSERGVIILRFDAQAKQVKMSAQGAGGLGDETLTATLTGKSKTLKGKDLDIDIAFNAVYLAQLLKVLSGKEFTLEMNTPTSPALIHAGGFTHLIMPISIRS